MSLPRAELRVTGGKPNELRVEVIRPDGSALAELGSVMRADYKVDAGGVSVLSVDLLAVRRNEVTTGFEPLRSSRSRAAELIEWPEPQPGPRSSEGVARAVAHLLECGERIVIIAPSRAEAEADIAATFRALQSGDCSHATSVRNLDLEVGDRGRLWVRTPAMLFDHARVLDFALNATDEPVPQDVLNAIGLVQQKTATTKGEGQ